MRDNIEASEPTDQLHVRSKSREESLENPLKKICEGAEVWASFELPANNDSMLTKKKKGI